MTDRDTRALLAEALEFFNDHPRFSLRRNRDRDSYALASRIEAHLATWRKPAHPAIEAARIRWNTVGFLRVDDDERIVDVSTDGYWVRSWIHVNPETIGEIDDAMRTRYKAAVEALPDLMRTVFLENMRENLSYREIAARHALSIDEVESLLSLALFNIGATLDAD